MTHLWSMFVLVIHVFHTKSIVFGDSIGLNNQNSLHLFLANSSEVYLDSAIVQREMSSLRSAGSSVSAIGLSGIDTDFGSCLNSGQSVDLTKYYLTSDDNSYVLYFSAYYASILIYMPYNRNRLSWQYGITNVVSLDLYDGTLAFRDSEGNALLEYATATGNYAVLQYDGNFVLYSTLGVAVWACSMISPACNYDRHTGYSQADLMYCPDSDSSSIVPSMMPSNPTASPSGTPQPSVYPTTRAPQCAPSCIPSVHPTGPSQSPTAWPTTAAPTVSAMPSLAPSLGPSVAPTGPSVAPTMAPTSHSPTTAPTNIPTRDPTGPSYAPTVVPSLAPTAMEDIGNCIYYGKSLSSVDAKLTSRSGKYSLEFVKGGNLFIYSTDNTTGERTVTWEYNFDNVQNLEYLLFISKLGNMKIQDGSFYTLFSSNTDGKNNYAIIQDDGNFVLYEDGGDRVGWDCSSYRCIVDSSGDVGQTQTQLQSCNNKKSLSSSRLTTSVSSPEVFVPIIFVCVVMFAVTLFRCRTVAKNALKVIPQSVSDFLNESEHRLSAAAARYTASLPDRTQTSDGSENIDDGDDGEDDDVECGSSGDGADFNSSRNYTVIGPTANSASFATATVVSSSACERGSRRSDSSAAAAPTQAEVELLNTPLYDERQRTPPSPIRQLPRGRGRAANIPFIVSSVAIGPSPPVVVPSPVPRNRYSSSSSSRGSAAALPVATSLGTGASNSSIAVAVAEMIPTEVVVLGTADT